MNASDLSVDQQVELLGGADTWHTAGFDEPPVAPIRTSDGPAGVRGTSWAGPASASFPCGTALGATWDPALVEQVGRALGREARAKNAHVLLAPTVNLHRTPISGRNFEFPSEDPVLAAAFAVAYVKGVQHERVACCIKHFVGNETEFERMTISAEIDERTLRELYLVPFEAAVKEAAVRAVMSAYNRLNGIYCADHRWLLTEVLREEWGFDGVVMSDWFGNHSTVESLRAGLDLEMPGPPRHRGRKLRAAIADGEVDADELLPSVQRLLALGEWTGAASTDTAEVTAADAETRAVIRQAAVAGTVLLKNDDALLPLTVAPARMALIGPYARFGRVQGGGSARVTPEHGVGPLEALTQRGVDVTFEPGGSIQRYLPALQGAYTINYADPGGATVSKDAPKLSWFWDHGPGGGIHPTKFGATITGDFVPDHTGEWEFGVRAVGPASVKLDGDVVVEVAEGETGGTFFGMGSPERRATVPLEAGRTYRLEAELAAEEAALVRGLAIGAAPVPAADLAARAVAAAAAAEVAIVIVGTDDEWETEGEDRAELGLPGAQDELVAAVAAANQRTIVVLNTGSPVAMPWLDAVPAVLQCWFPGQEIGDALADVLLGDAEPGGRLPLTFPQRIEDTPAFAHYPGTDGKAIYSERLHVGYRWYDRHEIEPLFPFGFGLGYTTFTMEAAAVEGTASGGASVRVDVTNTGSRAGSTVVQLYVEPPPGDEDRPLRHLAAFAKVHLDPGATEQVELALPVRAFSSWLDGAWRVPAGAYGLLIGDHSRSATNVGTVHASDPVH